MKSSERSIDPGRSFARDLARVVAVFCVVSLALVSRAVAEESSPAQKPKPPERYPTIISREAYIAHVQRRLRRNFGPPKVDGDYRRPAVSFQIDSSGLVLDAVLGTSSNLSALDRAAERAPWFGAPYDIAPEAVGGSSSFSARFDFPVSLRFEGSAPKGSQGTLSYDTPEGYLEVVEQLRKGNVSLADDYFETKHAPQSIQFIIAKNIWMQVLRGTRIQSGDNFRELIAAIPREWIGDALSGGRVPRLVENVARQFHDRLGRYNLSEIEVDKEFCRDLADLLDELSKAVVKTKHADAALLPNNLTLC